MSQVARPFAWAAIFAATVAAVPAAAAAQQTPEPRGRIERVVRPQGWIGVTFDFDLQQAWQAGTPVATPRMVISEVYEGSPAHRMGLQPGLKPEDMKASYKKGVLEVRLPRAKTSAAKQIPIET